MLDVLTIGSALQDVFIEVSGGQIVNGVGASNRQKYLGFAPDAKIPVEKLRRHLGGGGINTAVVFSKLELKAMPVINIGDDSWGEGIIKRLQERDIDTTLVTREADVPTGLSLVLHDVGEGEHLSFNYKGASDNLELVNTKLPAAKWLYVSGLTGDNWRDDIHVVAEMASEMPVAWNPGSIQIRSIGDLDEMLSNTEVLLVNKEEAAEILRQEGLTPVDDMRLVLRSLAELGPRHVIVTDGVKGANLFSEGMWYQAPIVHFDSIDATGAGDTFGATFVAGLMMEKDLKESLAMALVNSGAVTRAFGAQQGLMTRDEIERRISEVEVTEL